MRRLNVIEVHARKVEELGLDPAAVDLTSTESIAGALRRVASFLCPCTALTLIRAVTRPLKGLVDDLTGIKEMVELVLEAMIAHGDIIEQRETFDSQKNSTRTLLYAAPPSFVSRQSGVAILLGLASDLLSVLPDELEECIEYVNHVRRLVPSEGEDLRAELILLGLIELSYTNWIREPIIDQPAQHIISLNQLLASATQSFDIPGLSLLDPTHPVQYYRGRWVEPKAQSGNYVCRRTQAYGADLWCYVEIKNGIPIRFVDLPLKNSIWRGCDEAWRLQAAIDYERGIPQVFRVRAGLDGTRLIDFFSPVPMWARRRWDAVGEPVESSSCLFSYKFKKDEIKEELDFLKDKLWLAEAN